MLAENQITTHMLMRPTKYAACMQTHAAMTCSSHGTSYCNARSAHTLSNIVILGLKLLLGIRMWWNLFSYLSEIAIGRSS